MLFPLFSSPTHLIRNLQSPGARGRPLTPCRPIHSIRSIQPILVQCQPPGRWLVELSVVLRIIHGYWRGSYFPILALVLSFPGCQ